MNKKYLALLSLIILTFCVVGVKKVGAYGECSQYGLMVMYEEYSNSCKCMAGYVMSSSLTGSPYCVSGDSVCTDKYGYHSRYDYSSGSCECSYGYILGKDSIGRTQCVSPDSICEDRLGFNSRYNSLTDKCECRSGYVINGSSCQDGNMVCHSKHGYNSSYTSYNNSCECDSGYTLDESDQCVKKQNNAYFYLKELDTSNRKAILKSEYDYKYYLITYSYGCYASSFERYLNGRIIVNLGTDFDLDAWDKIVLQDDSETCDITQRESADSDTTLEEKHVQIYNTYSEPDIVPVTNVSKNIEKKDTKKQIEKPKVILDKGLTATSSQPNISKIIGTTTVATTTFSVNRQIHWYEKFWKFIWRF